MRRSAEMSDPSGRKSSSESPPPLDGVVCVCAQVAPLFAEYQYCTPPLPGVDATTWRPSGAMASDGSPYGRSPFWSRPWVVNPNGPYGGVRSSGPASDFAAACGARKANGRASATAVAALRANVRRLMRGLLLGPDPGGFVTPFGAATANPPLWRQNPHHRLAESGGGSGSAAVRAV